MSIVSCQSIQDFALTNGNFDGTPAKVSKEQQQKQSSTNNKGCRVSGKCWKCMIGDATNKIVDDVVLHCFCLTGLMILP